jgi:hypothetical protein
MQRAFWFVALMVVVMAGMAFAINDKVPMVNLRVMGGANDPISTSCTGTDGDFHGRQSLDVVGSMYNAGTTWYDFQHNGSEGKMISVDDLGFVHMVWMKGMNSANSPRHVYYNVFDPSSEMWLQTGGVQIDNATRAGYATQAVLPSGWCFPTFHTITSADNNLPHSGAAIDYGPGAGIFNTSRPANIIESGAALQLIWPKIAIGRDSTLHMVSIESPASGAAGDPQRLYYSRGHPVWDAQGNGLRIDWDNVDGTKQYLVFDTVMVIAPVIVSSTLSDRVAIVWSDTRDVPIDSATQYNNETVAIISEDGGYNWGPRVNITNFIAADMNCPSGDTVVCDRDTFRTYDDVAAIFDLNDKLHVAFTTCPYYSIEGLIGVIFSDIWHWDEVHREFSLIIHSDADTLDWNASNRAGAWQRMVQRPSLAIDRTTGYLYCAYQRYDSIYTSAGGYPQGDAFVSVSRNCGRTWSYGTNVTNTGHVSSPASGLCESERNITISDYVTYEGGRGYLHMEYEMDLDAGACIQTPPEGVCTNNPIYYQRIPVDSIPALPLAEWTFPALHVDSTGFPGRVIPLDPTGINPCGLAVNDHPQMFNPQSFKLYQNYPNPFNPTTNIQFDLQRSARVTLKVFNVLGEEVATLYSNKSLNAGVQTVSFDASALASGVYIYRLEVGGIATARKMVLMK